MNGWGWFFLILFLLLLVYAAWAGYHFYSAKKQGLPPPPLKSYIPFASRQQSSTNYPAPRSSGPLEWIKDQFSKLRKGRTHQGAYEETGAAESGYGRVGAGGQARGGGRAGGRGLEDDAWDTQVGNDDTDTYGAPGAHGPGGYYEEAELGLAPTPGYNNNTNDYNRNTDYMSQSTSYGGGIASQDKGKGRAGLGPENPFGDQYQYQAEAASMRSVSPRPELDMRKTEGHKKDNASLDSTHSSPTSIRKSAFREEDMR